jgi:hypothetical protein
MAPRALSDAAWITICQAAGLIPDSDARAEMAAILFVEYPHMAYHRAHVAKQNRLAKRMLRDLTVGMAQYDTLLLDHHRYYLDRLRGRAITNLFGYEALRRANAGRRDSQREWLISRLCGIWLYNFGASDLTVTNPALGGPPRGRLIKFLLAAMRQVIPRRKLPSAETLRDLIKRERQARENAKQYRLFLQQRAKGVLESEI